MSLLVALATYNEIQNLPTLVEAIKRQVPDADVLVVDDNSPDGTGKWCQDFVKERAWFSCIHREGKLGLGTAAWAAIRAAIERDYQWLIMLDADWSHPPDALPRLVAASADVDLVIGSRYCPGGGIENWPLGRRVLSRVMNFATRCAMGGNVGDASGSFRMYRVEMLEAIDQNKVQATGYAYLEELLWLCMQTGARIVEAPIVFTDRTAGASKANASEAWGKVKALCRIASERFRAPRRIGGTDAAS